MGNFGILSPLPCLLNSHSSYDQVWIRDFAAWVEETANNPLLTSFPASSPNYKNYEDLLSEGWIPGRRVDNSDSQYSSFRDNIPYLLILVIVHPLLRRAYNTIFPIPAASSTSNELSNSLPHARLNQRTRYDFVFALVLLCALHGFSAIKVLVILTFNYLIAKQLPRNYVVPMTWLFNVTTLFANELCKGYPYSNLANDTFPWTVWDPNQNWGTFFDAHSGLIPRWEILFNITILRLISFNMDHYWSKGREGDRNTLLEVRFRPDCLDKHEADRHKKKQVDPSNLSERDRVNISAAAEDYTFRNYLAYALYSPLYIAGPILTFNSYISQCKYGSRSITSLRTVRYGIRFLLCLLTMELTLHFIYAQAISKVKPAWEVYSPMQLSMIGYWNLHIIWLKLLLPWRFFRLWALADGIDPPENMVRCASDNYSTVAFWRGWHRSYNQWLLRYLYIPLGGSGGPGTRGKFGVARRIFNFLVVFTFVALWHDIQLRLLIWGWLITLFVLPEVLATLAFPKRKWQDRKTTYRMLCGVGAVGNILMMMAANLVGFAVGLDGLGGLLHGIFGSFSGKGRSPSADSVYDLRVFRLFLFLRCMRCSVYWCAGYVRVERGGDEAWHSHEVLKMIPRFTVRLKSGQYSHSIEFGTVDSDGVYNILTTPTSHKVSSKHLVEYAEIFRVTKR